MRRDPLAVLTRNRQQTIGACVIVFAVALIVALSTGWTVVLPIASIPLGLMWLTYIVNDGGLSGAVDDETAGDTTSVDRSE